MNGIVDEDLRALIDVSVGSAPNGAKSTVVAWIDTAFNGGLVLPRPEIDRLGLKESSSTSAILADGQQVELPTSRAIWTGSARNTARRSSPTMAHVRS
jgi:predicted aspartyl protease